MVTHLVVALVLLFLAVGTLFRPLFAFVAISLMFLLEQYAQSGSTFYTDRSGLLNVAVGLIAVQGVVVQFFKSGLYLKQYPAAGYVLLSLILLALASVVWSIHPQATMAMASYQAPYLILMLFSPLLISRFEDVQIAFKWIGLIGLALICLTLFTREFGDRGLRMAGSFYGRAAEVTGHKTDEGASLELSASAARIAIIAMFLPLFRIVPMGVVLRWAVVACAAALILASQTRGQMIFLFGVLLCFSIWIEGRGSLSFWVLMLLSVVGAGVLLTIGLNVGEGRWEWERIHAAIYEQRLYPIQRLLEVWLDYGPFYWLVGLGGSASFGPEILGVYPHNIPVEVLCEEGLFGFVLYMVFLGMVLRGGLKLSASRHLIDRSQSRESVPRLTKLLIAIIVFEWMLTLKQGALLTSFSFFLHALLLTRLVALNKARPGSGAVNPGVSRCKQV